MNETKTGGKRFRFNVIDVILIVILLGAVSALVYILAFSGKDSAALPEPVQIIYEVEIKNTREEFKGCIAVGDTVVDSVRRYNVGEVIDVRYEDAVYTGVNGDTGELVTSPYPGRTNIIMTVRATADVNSGYYNISGYQLLVGTKVSFRVPDFTGIGYCITVNEVKKA